MTRKTLALIAGAAMMAAAGAAQADDLPELLGSASYSAMTGTEMADVTGTYSFVEIDVIKGKFKTKVDLEDNVALAFADAVAVDEKTLTKTITVAAADDVSSVSSSFSFAAAD